MRERESNAAEDHSRTGHDRVTGADRQMNASARETDVVHHADALRVPSKIDGRSKPALLAPLATSNATNDDETTCALPGRVRLHETAHTRHGRHGRHGTRGDGRRRPRLRSPPQG